MAVSAKDLLEKPEILQGWINDARKVNLCPICKENQAGDLRIDGHRVCEDCYYEGLGELVEKSPIINPTRLGGKYVVEPVPPMTEAERQKWDNF